MASDIVGQLNQYLNDRFADGADWRADPKTKRAVILVVESAGLKWDTVYRWLTGRRTPPTAGLVQLARGLMIDADWLPYDVGKDVPTSIPNGPMRADDVRARLRGIIDERFEKNQPALRRLIEKAAGYRWDTFFYRKLRGSLAITEADVTRLAVAFGVMPRWLATGEGARENEWTRLYFDAIAWNPEDRPVGHPLVPPDGLVTGRWVDPYTKCRPQHRPRTRPPQFIMGPRVDDKSEPPPPTPPTRTVCGLPEMKKRLRKAKPKGMRKLLDKFVDAELEQPEPRKDALLLCLETAKQLEAVKRFKKGHLVKELTAALRNLDDAAAETPVRQPHAGYP